VEAAEGFYHTFEGWLVFVVAFMLLFVCGIILGKIGSGVRTSQPGVN